MSIKTDEMHATSKKMLSRLILKPMRQHETCENAVRDSVSMKKAITAFYWLRDRGYIRKRNNDYCSPFEVTEKGRLFYKLLCYDESKR